MSPRPHLKPRAAAPGWLLAGLALAALLGAVLHLLQLRFRAGDVYPPYSTLRADPLGARALYESYDRSGRWTCERHYDDVARLQLDPPATLFFLGDTVSGCDELPGSVVSSVGRFVSRGGRLVITLLPRNWTPPEDADDKRCDDEPAAAGTNRCDACGRRRLRHDRIESTNAVGDTVVSLPKRWGFGVIDVPVEKDQATAQRSAAPAPTNLPDALLCHTSVTFTNLAPGWIPIYERQHRPVIIQRRYGRGTIVFSALSYFASNESLQREPQAALLAWLAGPSRRLVFDEAHHGLVRKVTLGSLGRAYGFTGFLAGLLALAGLYIWRSSIGLLPPEPSAARAAEGRGSSSGLTTLLRRTIPTDRILAVCLAEWRRAAAAARDPAADARAARAEAVVQSWEVQPGRRRKAAAAYNAICRILNERPAHKEPT